MANKVFANGREISCKAAKGKTICAMPDVCFTPPENPATPPGVPIPYPNTGMASDTTSGSKTVKISGKEVGLKNKSYFKKSMGDEAGCAAKKGILTSTNRGKVYFKSWSMDVKIEGKNAVRHLDMTTNNHMSDPGDTPPWVYLDSMAVAPDDHPCKKQIDEAQEKCSKSSLTKEKTADGNEKTVRDCSNAPGCKEAMQCVLVPKNRDNDLCCRPDNTGHHLIEDHWIWEQKGKLMPDFSHLAEKEGRLFKKPGGPYGGAPTMCVNKDRYSGRHGIAHSTGGVVEDTLIGKRFTYGQGKAIALVAHSDACPDADCGDACLESQLDAFYGEDLNKEFKTPDRKQPLGEEQRAEALGRFGIPNAD